MSHGAVWMMLTNRPHVHTGARLHVMSDIRLWKVFCAKRGARDAKESELPSKEPGNKKQALRSIASLLNFPIFGR